MHFVDAWTSLEPLELALLLGGPAIAIVALLLPGRAIARVLALGMAACLALVPGFDPPLLRAAWVALWLGVAAVSGARRDEPPHGRASRAAGVESGAIALLLGGVLLALVLVALGREDLPAEVTRPAAIGFTLVAAGVAHLMLRRDALRGAFAFAVAGCGLQWLDHAARLVVIDAAALPEATLLLATALAVALAVRLAWVRQRDAGSAWVTHAHDLHD